MSEAISAQVTLLLDLRHPDLTIQFLHALLTLLNAESNEESKFLALRCFSDILVAFLNEERNSGIVDSLGVALLNVILLRVSFF